MSQAPRLDLSVIVPFGDDEEVIGAAMRQLAAALRASGLTFEIIAVDEDSADNSHAVLALVRPEISELRVIQAPPRTRAVEAGVDRAQGHVLAVLSPPEVSTSNVAGFLAAAARVHDRVDVEIALGRYIVAHRVRTLDAFAGVRLRGEPAQRRFGKRLAVRGLRVAINGAPLVPPPVGMARLRAAFVARRAS